MQFYKTENPFEHPEVSTVRALPNSLRRRCKDGGRAAARDARLARGARRSELPGPSERRLERGGPACSGAFAGSDMAWRTLKRP